jgi:hypothetical protein
MIRLKENKQWPARERHCTSPIVDSIELKWTQKKKDNKKQARWNKGDVMRITYTEVGDDGIDVGDRDPTRRPRCCEG